MLCVNADRERQWPSNKSDILEPEESRVQIIIATAVGHHSSAL